MLHHRACALVLFGTIVLLILGRLRAREWSDATGKFRIEAKLLTVKDGNAYLEKADGSVIPVPLEKLSKDDLKHLASLPEHRRYLLEHPLPGFDLAKTMVHIKVDDESQVGEIRRFTDFGSAGKSLAFSPNAGLLAVGTLDGCLTVFDLNSSQRVSFHERLPGLEQVTCLAFTPDGKKLLSGGYRGRIEIWNVAPNGTLTGAGRFVGHSQQITSITISSDGGYVLSGSLEKKARYWNLETAREEFAIDGFRSSVQATFITHKRKQGLACDGQTMVLIDLQTGKVIQSMKLGSYTTRTVAIAPDGSRVVVGDGYRLRMWDIRSGHEFTKLEDRETQWAATFSPDAKHVISGGRGKINLWEVETSRKIYEFDAVGPYDVQALAYSPDNRHIAGVPAVSGKALQVFRLPADAAN